MRSVTVAQLKRKDIFTGRVFRLGPYVSCRVPPHGARFPMKIQVVKYAGQQWGVEIAAVRLIVFNSKMEALNYAIACGSMNPGHSITVVEK